MEYPTIFKEKKQFVIKILLSLFLFFFIATIFSGCTSTDKTDTAGAISKDITYTYNIEDDTTKIDFSLYFKNNTIYNLTKEDCTFRLYKNNIFVKDVNFYWNFNVKANSDGTRDSFIIVDGDIDKLELVSWVSTFDNLWNTYKIWWILIIIIPIVLAVIYLIVILVKDLNLEDIFENIEPYISILAIYGLFYFIPLFINGLENWFPMIISLIGATSTIVLCLLMSGIKAIVE